MEEPILKKYFKNEISAKQLAEDLKNSQQKTAYDTTSVPIKSIENGEFKIETEHLVKLCEAFINKQITREDLKTIGFALLCSDFFHWDNETKSGEIISQVISDWNNENIGFGINPKNVQLWKEYLESGNYCLDKNELKKKFRRKGKWKKLYQEIDEILWNDWDPIGINDVAPRDEYQTYTPLIFSLKRKGANEEEISNRLHELEKTTIGVSGNLENCKNVARKIIELNE
ncbi:MAG: hypothetical protein WAT79_01250 [Saprospiraceae bacterium]